MSFPPPLRPAAPVPPRKNTALVAAGAVVLAAIAYAAFHRSSGAAGTPGVEPEKPNAVKLKLPAWVPIYPGSVLASDVTTRRTPNELFFTADYSTTASCNKVLFWYRDKVRSLGYRYGGMDVHIPAPMCFYADDSPDAERNSGQFHSDSADRNRSLDIGWSKRAIPQGDSEKILYVIHIGAVERNRQGGPPETVGNRAIPRIPDWAPVFPGAMPTMMSVQQSSEGTMIPFEFSTNESCAAVVDWYQQQLQQEGFRTYGRIEDHSRPNGCDVRLSADGSAGRSLKIRAVTYTFNVHVDVQTMQK
ncbi:MAG TPA: hypothetical protein VJ732_02655 [Bryobacteraceae bacterium]|nr:hypothetical protein [Bryobacteraceae bacterium]